MKAPTRERAFDGETYESWRDYERLVNQHARVFVFMSDHRWHTLAMISDGTGDPEASVSARLRDLRKKKWGGWRVRRRYVGDGLWEYKLVADSGTITDALR